jgi:outer membrane receptor protein involved in Fe transport
MSAMAKAFDPSISAELTAGNYGAVGGSVSVTGGLTDQIAGRLFVAHRERDGFYDVFRGDGPRTANQDADQSFYTIRGQVLITPSAKAKIPTA